MKHNLELRDVLNELKEWGNKDRPLSRCDGCTQQTISIPNLNLYIVHRCIQHMHDDSSNHLKVIYGAQDKNQITNLTTYSLKMLKTQCRNNNVKVSGTKRELINRLIQLA